MVLDVFTVLGEKRPKFCGPIDIKKNGGSGIQLADPAWPSHNGIRPHLVYISHVFI